MRWPLTDGLRWVVLWGMTASNGMPTLVLISPADPNRSSTHSRNSASTRPPAKPIASAIG